MLSKKERKNGRLRRKRRIRKKVFGTADRPRMSVFRSNRHIYVQLINDITGETLASASTIEEELAGDLDGKKKVDQAAVIGKAVGERAKAKGIESAVFDRNGYIYHGRVAAIADGAREAGLSL
jgi:large subunit ribosomal protein L18